VNQTSPLKKWRIDQMAEDTPNTVTYKDVVHLTLEKFRKILEQDLVTFIEQSCRLTIDRAVSHKLKDRCGRDFMDFDELPG